jgi:hypothetical protein
MGARRKRTTTGVATTAATKATTAITETVTGNALTPSIATAAKAEGEGKNETAPQIEIETMVMAAIIPMIVLVKFFRTSR